MDVVNIESPADSDTQDLLQDHLWERLLQDLQRGQYHAVAMGTPCETASRARTGPPGPRPLRSSQHIYGLPKSMLSESEHTQVKQGTYFALQSARTASAAHALGIPWLIENPDPHGNPVSLFNLPEWLQLADLPGVSHVDFHQCTLGAETAKPTRLLFGGLALSHFSARCDHPKKEWRYNNREGVPSSCFAPHPPLAGRRRSDGAYATKAAAAWPSRMNKAIATAIAASAPGPHPPLYHVNPEFLPS